ncbi:pyridoxal phosphate-dependent decarboxylase family protein [Pendulispora albinea]|uniref:Aminotransferase class V-fold PLP-dependent enzyme n=1 Tax=Pendulispora albinea TaxID=2741071 RepID=A0ABZ2LPP5_9BACT
MSSTDTEALLRETLDHALAYLRSSAERPVGVPCDVESLRARLAMPLSEHPMDAQNVVADLVSRATPGLVSSVGPRYFGFVVGGSLPAALAAEWLTAAWDQNAALYKLSPAAMVVEEVVSGWLTEIFGLPSTASVGFVSGCQMASFTGLCAARGEVLRRAGWDLEERGLAGAPPLTVVLGEEAHATIYTALRMLGIGRRQIVTVAADAQGRMRADALAKALGGVSGPLVVCAQLGNVNTGAFDPCEDIAELTHEHGGWLHVDGAFGLWAAASPALRHLVRGAARADSWAVDGHKWLNVPYDSAYAIVADPRAHRAAVANTAAAYLVPGDRGERDAQDWVPESSRRARGFAVYAALRALGRSGLAELVERTCGLARRMAERLAGAPGVAVLNEVVLNQVLVRFAPRGGDGGGDADAFTREVIARVQRDGTCWVGPTVWKGQAAMRISVANWSTSEADADRSVDAILRAARS